MQTTRSGGEIRNQRPQIFKLENSDETALGMQSSQLIVEITSFERKQWPLSFQSEKVPPPAR